MTCLKSWLSAHWTLQVHLHRQQSSARAARQLLSLASTNRIKDLGFCDVVESVKGMTPVQVNELVNKLTNGKMADVTINCVNVPDQEMTAVLCTKDDGIVYFFSMATSFTKAALGAEGIGADVTMIIGNGYTKGHAEITLQELRECPKLRKLFEELYA